MTFSDPVILISRSQGYYRALDVLCAQLTRALFAIAKFLVMFRWICALSDMICIWRDRNVWNRVKGKCCSRLMYGVVCSLLRYTTALVDSSLSSQAYNPELTVDPRKSNSVIDQQIMQLKLVTNKLRKAYSGFYVDWIDISSHGLSVLSITVVRCDIDSLILIYSISSAQPILRLLFCQLPLWGVTFIVWY